MSRGSRSHVAAAPRPFQRGSNEYVELVRGVKPHELTEHPERQLSAASLCEHVCCNNVITPH